MKILVTGANGQLGAEVRKISGDYPDFEFVFADIEELDLSNFNAVSDFFDKEKPDFLINCAAYTAVDIAEEDRDLAALVNTKVPAELGQIAHRSGCRVVHVSTDYVFDGTNHIPYTEDDLVSPETVYGKTKLNGEIALLKEDPEAIIIRTSWLYSSFGKNFVKTMIRLGEERDNLKVVCDQIGTPTYAGDLAAVILQIIQNETKGVISWKHGIYHFSNEGVCSWYDFANAIHEIAGVDCKVNPIPTAEYPTPTKRPLYSVLDKSKIKKYQNLSIPYWRDSLKLCINELKNKN